MVPSNDSPVASKNSWLTSKASKLLKVLFPHPFARLAAGLIAGSLTLLKMSGGHFAGLELLIIISSTYYTIWFFYLSWSGLQIFRALSGANGVPMALVISHAGLSGLKPKIIRMLIDGCCGTALIVGNAFNPFAQQLAYGLWAMIMSVYMLTSASYLAYVTNNKLIESLKMKFAGDKSTGTITY